MATKTGTAINEIVNGKADNGQVGNLNNSGIDVVLTTCLYAIIGAIGLQRGGAVASEVAREKVLKPLGIS